MQLSVQVGGATPLHGSGLVSSARQTRSGREMPTLPTLSCARAAMQSQPVLFMLGTPVLIAEDNSQGIPEQSGCDDAWFG